MNNEEKYKYLCFEVGDIIREDYTASKRYPPRHYLVLGRSQPEKEYYNVYILEIDAYYEAIPFINDKFSSFTKVS